MAYSLIIHGYSRIGFVYDKNYPTGSKLRTLFFGKLYTSHTENGNSVVIINVWGHGKLTEFPGTHLKP